jgi:hypothetical protein
MNEDSIKLPLASPLEPTYKMSSLGKVFFASLLASITSNQRSPFKLTGDPRKLEVLVKAIESSKKFHDEARRPGATVESIIRALDMKNVSARNFADVFGTPWPL